MGSAVFSVPRPCEIAVSVLLAVVSCWLVALICVLIAVTSSVLLPASAAIN